MESIIILPTIECNIDCGHCGQGRDIKSMTMEDSLLERLLNEVKSERIPQIKISGGEVTSLRYKDRLLAALTNTQVGSDRELYIETNAWWGSNLEYARKFVGQLEAADVSYLLVSTDTFHAQFVPIRSIANVIRSIEETSMRIDVIDVRSFQSTFQDDVALIKELARLAEMPISKTTVLYSKTLDGSFKTRVNGGFYDVFERFGGLEGMRREFVGEVIYSLGPDSDFNPMFGTTGVNVRQMWAIWAGVARENVDKADVISSQLSGSRPIRYSTKLVEPMVMPDGSLVADCYWTQMNDRKRARLGVYPQMSLSEFERASQSRLYATLKAGGNLATYPLALLTQKA